MAAQVASPPYDVLSAAEARAMAANNPNSFLRVNKAEIDFDDSVDAYSEQVYQRGRDNLNRLRHDGIMIRDEKPCLYLYRLTWRGKSQTGLVCLTSVDEYDAGKIKKHEHTLPEKVNDRANHITYLGAQVGPVFSTFRHTDSVTAVFRRLTAGAPTTDFESKDGVRHELWVIDDDTEIQALVAAFAKLDCLYIADGHHRSQSASEVCRRERENNPQYTGDEPFNYFLDVLFADSELRILPYNRVVKDLNGLTAEQVLAKAREKFEVTAAAGEVEPAERHQFGMYLEGKWFKLTAKAGTFDEAHPTESIDAAILGANLIDPVFGITNPKTDKRIDFIGGIRGTAELVKLVDSGGYKVGLALHATGIDQLLNVADSGEVMPPKSTWFEPKLRSGMVVNLLKE